MHDKFHASYFGNDVTGLKLKGEQVDATYSIARSLVGAMYWPIQSVSSFAPQT